MESKAATPELVRHLTEPTKNFLCQLKDNVYNIKFGAFRIREMTNGIVLVDVKDTDLDKNVTEEMDPSTRLLKYHFGPDFLRLGTIGL
jgi:hypothetical protein